MLKRLSWLVFALLGLMWTVSLLAVAFTDGRSASNYPVMLNWADIGFAAMLTGYLVAIIFREVYLIKTKRESDLP